MDARIVVVGAGPAGLCLATALAGRGFQVDVVDRQSAETLATPPFDGREVALTQTSIQLLQSLGIWRRIAEADKAPIARARIMDDAAAGFVVDSASVARDRLGVLVSNHVIRAAAWEAASTHANIRFHGDVLVERLETGPVSAAVGLSDGSRLQARLVVAADGRFSALRRMRGIATSTHDFGKTMLLVRAHHAGSNDRTAWEWFGRGQTRALLPLGDRLSSLVLTVDAAEAQHWRELSPEQLGAELALRYEGRLGAVTPESTLHAYPLVATWAHRFAATRFALVGDAAIGMHPVTAHGFNLGLAGVRHLAGAVAEGAVRHGDPGHARALAQYQRRLCTSGALIFAGTQALARLYTDDRRRALPLRRALLQAGSRIAPLRQALAAHVTADLPLRESPLRHVRGALRALRPQPRTAGRTRGFQDSSLTG